MVVALMESSSYALATEIPAIATAWFVVAQDWPKHSTTMSMSQHHFAGHLLATNSGHVGPRCACLPCCNVIGLSIFHTSQKSQQQHSWLANGMHYNVAEGCRKRVKTSLAGCGAHSVHPLHQLPSGLKSGTLGATK